MKKFIYNFLINMFFSIGTPNNSENKPLQLVNIRRLHAKQFSKIYFENPSMWNHRLNNNTMEIWPYQINYQSFIQPSYLSDFIFRDSIVTDFDTFLKILPMSKNCNTECNEHVSVENIAILYHGYSTKDKNYTINCYDGNIGTYYPILLEDKLLMAKSIILIMNETDPEKINYTNYGNLVHWYIKNSGVLRNVSNDFFML